MLAPVDLVPIGNVDDFKQSHRYVLSFRSWTRPAEHTQVLIYRTEHSPDPASARWYSIKNECEHLGLPLEAGDIEDFGPACTKHDDDDDEYEDDDDTEDEQGEAQPVIICPFHQYDFGLKTGTSTSGLRACTYKVEARSDGKLWIEPPGDRADDFRILGVRMISERFAHDPDSPHTSTVAPDLSDLLSLISLDSEDDSHPSTIVRNPAAIEVPTSIVGWCRLILLAPSPNAKVTLVRHLVHLFRSGQMTRLSDPVHDLPQPAEPYRDPLRERTVAPGQATNRGKGGSVQNRIKLLHALAAIEQWAIDLAIDCVSRFHAWKVGTREGVRGRKLPWSFVHDFLKVAEDEAKHFSLLQDRLEQMGCKYGDLAVHGSLWESATETSHSLFSRLAIIHLVHEARGLDSNPTQIRRCRVAGDEASASLLEIIHYDEITHVAAGHRHFLHLCEHHEPPLDPITTFRKEVETHFYGQLRGPFNEQDRDKAGMEKGYYENLKGRGFGIGPKTVES